MNNQEVEELLERVKQNLVDDSIVYKQYIHQGICKTGPCPEVPYKKKELCCAPYVWCIHASDSLHALPKHAFCDCKYEDVGVKPVGSISERQPAPDVWLKLFGKLPEYYITKEEAIEKYGWRPGRNTLAGKAPGKMIGGEVYVNKDHVLPEKEGRVWYECDVDYESGGRSSMRLFYSNDGLMFFSTDHGETIFYWIR